MLRDLVDVNNQLQLTMFVTTDITEATLLPVDSLLKAIEVNKTIPWPCMHVAMTLLAVTTGMQESKDLYAANGFTSLAVTQLVPPTDPPQPTQFTLLEIVGITVGAVIGFSVLIVMLVVFYRWYEILLTLPLPIILDQIGFALRS